MITIESDIEQTQKALSYTSKSLKSIENKVLRIINKGTIKAIKSEIRMTTTRQTGQLLNKSYVQYVKNGVGKVLLNYKIDRKNLFPKVYTLNYGTKGHKPRSFVQKGMQYVENGNYKNDIENMIQKELDKYWG